MDIVCNLCIDFVVIIPSSLISYLLEILMILFLGFSPLKCWRSKMHFRELFIILYSSCSHKKSSIRHNYNTITINSVNLTISNLAMVNKGKNLIYSYLYLFIYIY